MPLKLIISITHSALLFGNKISYKLGKEKHRELNAECSTQRILHCSFKRDHIPYQLGKKILFLVDEGNYMPPVLIFMDHIRQQAVTFSEAALIF